MTPFILSLMACCENLANIQNACAGGRGTAKDIITAYVACEDDVTALGTPSSHVISTITMASGKTFFQWDIDPVGSSMKTTTQGDGQAQEYLTTVILKITGIASAVSYGINSLIKGNALLIVKDKNGLKHIVGAAGDGANVKIDVQNEPNGYLVTFIYSSGNIPYNYSGTIALPA